MEYGQTGHTIETGGRHIIIVANAAHIRVGVISKQYRVGVGTITIVGTPYP